MSLFLSQAPFSENININYSNINSLPVYTKIESSTALNISAKKIMVESDRGINYFSRSENEVQPIASITKLMTALVFLDKDLDLNQTYTIKEDDTIDGGKRHFFIGEEIKLKDVLNTALVGSDNEAAAILAKAGGYEVSEFVKLMNRKARDLGMINTNFIDPTGLNKGNVSTANEVVILFNKAWQIEEIREAISRSEYSFETLQGREKKITSTDYSLFETSPNYLGGKTGYIEEAGYSFVGNFKVADDEVVVVVLNSETKNSRFSESLELSKIVRDKYFK
ncbi:MAG: serine hydrolase [Patescibacteria group bacterium]|nr:serine hydrolase [Patescibacteria group bacterium]